MAVARMTKRQRDAMGVRVGQLVTARVSQVRHPSGLDLAPSPHQARAHLAGDYLPFLRVVRATRDSVGLQNEAGAVVIRIGGGAGVVHDHDLIPTAILGRPTLMREVRLRMQELLDHVCP